MIFGSVCHKNSSTPAAVVSVVAAVAAVVAEVDASSAADVVVVDMTEQSLFMNAMNGFILISCLTEFLLIHVKKRSGMIINRMTFKVISK